MLEKTSPTPTQEVSQQNIAKSLSRIFKLNVLSSALKVLVGVSIFGAVVTNFVDFNKLEKHVAVVSIKGEIKDDSSTSFDSVAPLLKEAFDNENSAGVVIKMSSPGGSPDQSIMIYDEIKRLKNESGKKVDVVINDICASGCYFIASAADNIYSQKTSIIGSIGVITSGFDFTEAMSKYGVKDRTITAGENKGFMNPYQSMTTKQIDFWKSQLESTHQVFIDSVKEGRGNRIQAEDAGIFTGLIYAAPNALKLGLIDGYNTAQNIAQNKYQGLPLAEYALSAFVQQRTVPVIKEAISSTLADTISQLMSSHVQLK